MKKLILTFGLLASGFSFGADWVYVISAKSGDQFFLDADYYKYNFKNQTTDVWVRSDSKTGLGEKLAEVLNTQPTERMYTNSKALVRFACESGMSKTLAITKYDSNGVVLKSTSKADADFSLVFPDSIDEALLEVACKSRGKGLALPKYKPEFVDLEKLGYKAP
ncbi:surface-adhesin E family protein [Acinetobacter sp. YH12086]|uniref:surface-adhesin E family protein n=1 Tax=Acinetobacter sp. YH12086 TaxID=2601078 RepID=UPI0015D12D2D|nr:surface-adhesin E family protein [Acinetobacter sp. YH12086]